MENEIAVMAFGFIGVLVWFGFWVGLAMKISNKYYSFGLGMICLIGGGFVLPALIVGIVSLII